LDDTGQGEQKQDKEKESDAGNPDQSPNHCETVESMSFSRHNTLVAVRIHCLSRIEIRVHPGDPREKICRSFPTAGIGVPALNQKICPF
jgi:hypothetical protein